MGYMEHTAVEWREIPETDYSVSNIGQVASRKKGGWRVLCPVQDSHGYPVVTLCDGRGGHRTAKVHILVAEAFIGPRPTPKHEVNHKSGARANPHVDNLEWVTRSEQQRHRFDVLKHGALRGEAVGNSKLTEADAKNIVRRWASGETQYSIATAYGISQPSVSMIVNRKNWAWIDRED